MQHCHNILSVKCTGRESKCTTFLVQMYHWVLFVVCSFYIIYYQHEGISTFWLWDLYVLAWTWRLVHNDWNSLAVVPLTYPGNSLAVVPLTYPGNSLAVVPLTYPGNSLAVVPLTYPGSWNTSITCPCNYAIISVFTHGNERVQLLSLASIDFEKPKSPVT